MWGGNVGAMNADYLQHELHVIGIYLFGSYVTGEAHAH